MKFARLKTCPCDHLFAPPAWTRRQLENNIPSKNLTLLITEVPFQPSLEQLHRRKDELLKVLDYPQTPLHTNASENDLRTFVTGGTMSRDGRVARDTMLGLLKTCQKLKLSFYHYLGDRLGLGGEAIAQLAGLMAAKG